MFEYSLITLSGNFELCKYNYKFIIDFRYVVTIEIITKLFVFVIERTKGEYNLIFYLLKYVLDIFLFGEYGKIKCKMEKKNIYGF